MDTFSALRGLAGFVAGLTLLAFAVTVLASVVLWRLRQDRLALQAAERFEPVDITVIVKRHVPGHLQSNKASEEIPIAKDGIGRKFPRWTAVAILSCAVTVVMAAAARTLIDRNREAIAAARIAAQAPPPVDALKAITGVWGWKYDFRLSCSQNPHTISIGEADRKLSIKFAKPVYWDGTETIGSIDYTIIGTEPNKIVLSRDLQSNDSFVQPIKWYIRFMDANTYDIRRSDQPSNTTGDIIRCN